LRGHAGGAGAENDCGEGGGGLILSGMGGPATNPPTLPDLTRASDAERDEAVIQLKDEFISGRLSQETFVHRVQNALQARRRDEIEPLLADLPIKTPKRSHGERLRDLTAPMAKAFGDAVRATRRAAATVRAAGPEQRPADLYFPPDGERAVFTIGREENCDLFVPDMTVSRIHARLTRGAAGWMLADLGSTNGTRVNGWRVREPVAIRDGDRVRFGAMAFVMRDVP
jgi:hypothetical protein